MTASPGGDLACGAGVPEIEQVGPSVLRFALRLPAGAELRFTPALHREAVAALLR